MFIHTSVLNTRRLLALHDTWVGEIGQNCWWRGHFFWSVWDRSDSFPSRASRIGQNSFGIRQDASKFLKEQAVGVKIPLTADRVCAFSWELGEGSKILQELGGNDQNSFGSKLASKWGVSILSGVGRIAQE